MASKGITNRLQRAFEEQFEPQGVGYLYRKSRRGTLFQVSELERRAMVGSYMRGLRLVIFGLFLAFLGAGPLIAVYFPTTSPRVVPLIAAAIPILAIAIFAIVNAWLWNRPERQLERRNSQMP